MTETIDVDVSAIRSALLEVIGDLSSQYDNLQSSSVIQHAARKVLNRQPDRQVERALLASFYDLFRTGYVSWGHDLANPAPPFCHVTELGRRALAQRSRDPANPEGYLSHLRSRAGISSLTHSYRCGGTQHLQRGMLQGDCGHGGRGRGESRSSGA